MSPTSNANRFLWQHIVTVCGVLQRMKRKGYGAKKSVNVSEQNMLSVIFTARLHVMQRTVLPRPFCPSVKRVHVTKRKKLVPTFIYRIKIICPSFLTRRWLAGATPSI